MASERVIRPIGEPLRLAALEVGEMAQMSQRLQALVAALASGSARGAAVSMEAQNADYLTQRLEGLQAFLQVLAEAAPIGVDIDVSQAVIGLLLAEQARRLSGNDPVPDVEFANGELQLFED